MRWQDTRDLPAVESTSAVRQSQFDGAGDREVATTGNIAGVSRRADAPWTWDVTLVPARRWSVRIHVSLLVFLLLQLLRVAFPAATNPVPSNIRAAVIVLVMVCWCALLHESAREFVSRRCGARHGTLSLAPWGGACWSIPPGAWVHRLSAAAAGPVVLALIVGLSAGVLAMLRQPLSWEWLPSPFSDAGFRGLESDWVSALIWLLGWTASMMLLVSLLPFHPMAGGRILESLLETRLECRGARERTLWLGTGLALFGCVIALAMNSLLMLLACAIGLAVSSRGGRLLRLGLELHEVADWQGDSEALQARRSAQRAVEDRLDALLAKIAKGGMASLSWRERRFLRSATRRKRG